MLLVKRENGYVGRLQHSIVGQYIGHGIALYSFGHAVRGRSTGISAKARLASVVTMKHNTIKVDTCL